MSLALKMRATLRLNKTFSRPNKSKMEQASNRYSVRSSNSSRSTTSCRSQRSSGIEIPMDFLTLSRDCSKLQVFKSLDAHNSQENKTCWNQFCLVSILHLTTKCLSQSYTDRVYTGSTIVDPYSSLPAKKRIRTTATQTKLGFWSVTRTNRHKRWMTLKRCKVELKKWRKRVNRSKCTKEIW